MQKLNSSEHSSSIRIWHPFIAPTLSTFSEWADCRKRLRRSSGSWSSILSPVALFIAPVIGAIPAFATAPALILVGSLMASHASEIDWANPLVALPAFLTITTIPLTFSIANGLAFGFCCYTLLRIARGEFRKVGWLVYVLTALFLARFIYLGRE